MVNGARVSTDLERYIASLASPEDPQSAIVRVPTRNSKFSSTFQSVTTFPILYSSAWTADQGRFCVLAKPILGDAGGSTGGPAPPTQWKICLADGNLSSWQAGGTWSSSLSYTPYSGGKDLRVDKFCPFFTSPDPFFSRYTGGGTFSVRAPLGTTPSISEQNISTDYVIVPTAIGLTLLGPGNYFLTLNVAGTGISAITPNFFLPPASGLTAAVNGTDYQITPTSANISSDGTLLAYNWVVTLSTSLYLGYTLTATTITGSVQNLAGVYQQYNDNTQNGGAIDRIRPVSMSLLVTCTVADLVNGGTICGKLLNKSQCNKEFYVDVTNAETGQFQDWESLADTGNQYNGRFEDGARVIWLPEDDSDTDFYTPDESLQHDFPCALINGQFTPGQTGFPSGQIARAIVCSNYEFTTSYTCLTGEKMSGNDMLMSEAFNIMNTMPTATMNGAHLEYVKRVIARAAQGAASLGKWAWANREPIMTTGRGLMALTALM